MRSFGNKIILIHFKFFNAFSFRSHRQYSRVVEDLYLEQDTAVSIHKELSLYWECKWATIPKPIPNASKSADRYITHQSILVSGHPNIRRLTSIVWHQLESLGGGYSRAAKTLQDMSHLGAAIEAGLFWDVLATFRVALIHENADDVLLPQLTECNIFRS